MGAHRGLRRAVQQLRQPQIQGHRQRQRVRNDSSQRKDVLNILPCVPQSYSKFQNDPSVVNRPSGAFRGPPDPPEVPHTYENSADGGPNTRRTSARLALGPQWALFVHVCVCTVVSHQVYLRALLFVASLCA
jgi:hypothetical protein